MLFNHRKAIEWYLKCMQASESIKQNCLGRYLYSRVHGQVFVASKTQEITLVTFKSISFGNKAHIKLFMIP